MNPWYCMTNECLRRLMLCDIPAMEKLRLEGKLIHMKKMLVTGPFLPGSHSICEMDLEKLLERISEISAAGYDKEALQNISCLADRVETVLGGLVEQPAVP